METTKGEFPGQRSRRLGCPGSSAGALFGMVTKPMKITAILPLKNGAWETTFIWGFGLFSDATLVLGMVK